MRIDWIASVSSDSAIGTASAIVCAGKSCSAIATSPNARSRSSSTTSRRPRSASAAARLVASVVLPQPPLAENTVTTRPLVVRLGGGRRLRRRLLAQRGRQVRAALDGGLDPERVAQVDDLADAGPQRVLQQRRRHLDADQDDAEARPVDAHVVGDARTPRPRRSRGRGRSCPRRTARTGAPAAARGRRTTRRDAAQRLPERLGGVPGPGRRRSGRRSRHQVADRRWPARSGHPSSSAQDREVQLAGLLARRSASAPRSG